MFFFFKGSQLETLKCEQGAANGENAAVASYLRTIKSTHSELCALLCQIKGAAVTLNLARTAITVNIVLTVPALL